MIFQTLYICVAAFIEVVAYSLLIDMTVKTTEENHGIISSISEAMSLSTSVASYYTFIIYVFAIGRNGYEFYIDPYKRLDSWKNNKYLYMSILVRIIFLNLLMLFLLLIATISSRRDIILHNQFSTCAIAFYFLLEITCICIRIYYVSINNLSMVKNKPLYIFILCTEVLLSIVAICLCLCFTSILEMCPYNTDIVYISEYLLFFIIIFTPIYRILD